MEVDFVTVDDILKYYNSKEKDSEDKNANEKSE